MKNKEYYDLNKIIVETIPYELSVQYGDVIVSHIVLRRGQNGYNAYNDWLEENHEVLTTGEKIYLDNLLRPMVDYLNVICIKKVPSVDKKWAHLVFTIDGNVGNDGYFSLPYFPIDKYYNGLILGKEYSLDDLCLDLED